MVTEQQAKNPKQILKFQVPFLSNGRMCDKITHCVKNDTNLMWVENEIFEDELEYTGYTSSTSGNSKIHFNSSRYPRRYNMFMSDFDDILNLKLFANNKIRGKFCFIKRSSALGIRMIFETA